MTIPTRKSLPGSVDSFGYSLWSSRRVLRRRNSEPEWSFLFNEEASARGCYCSLLCFPRSLGGGGEGEGVLLGCARMGLSGTRRLLSPLVPGFLCEAFTPRATHLYREDPTGFPCQTGAEPPLLGQESKVRGKRIPGLT